MLSASEIRYAFAKSSALTLDGAELHVDDGEVVGLIGPNGSGKTTFLRTLYRSLTASSGTVLIDGTDMSGLSTRQIAQQLAVVVQESSDDPGLTVAEMVLLGRSPHLGPFDRLSDQDHHAAAEALRRVGARDFADRPFAALSGGEKQRVLIARALAQGCRNLLLDEPTNHLDFRFQHEVLQLVRTLATSTVVVLHDLNLASRYCDRLVLLHRGRVVASGPVGDVLQPEVLRPVYEIDVRRIEDDGVQLLFRPLDEHPARR